MSKLNKYLPVFFLWIGWLVITAHLIFPHDHHSDNSFSCQEDSSHGSTGNKGHHSGFPVHCHAFNDLTSEKVTVYILRENIQSDDLSVSSYPDAFVFELQVHLISIFDIRKSFPDFRLLELSPFRAPPSLS